MLHLYRNVGLVLFSFESYYPTPKTTISLQFIPDPHTDAQIRQVMGSQSDALAVPARKSQQPQDVAFGQARLSPTMRIGRGGSYYNLAQLMKFLNVSLVWHCLAEKKHLSKDSRDNIYLNGSGYAASKLNTVQDCSSKRCLCTQEDCWSYSATPFRRLFQCQTSTCIDDEQNSPQSRLIHDVYETTWMGADWISTNFSAA